MDLWIFAQKEREINLTEVRIQINGDAVISEVMSSIGSYVSILWGSFVSLGVVLFFSFLVFFKRSANHVAHFVARYSSSLADRIWAMSNAHPVFINVLMND